MAEKKKILLLSDDLRMTSGIATVSNEFVMGSMDKFDWIQLGAAVKHPDHGKEIDLGDDVRKQTGIKDASLKIIPWNGYGDANILRQLIMRHQPDAILHFTDPRYWRWLYEMEAEVRENIPILFYHIWDDLPDPKYNRDYYESCDWLGCISKQTYGIVSRVSKLKTKTNIPLKDNQVKYVPHGINPIKYKKSDVPDKWKEIVLGKKWDKYKFGLFWTNRNIKRKQPSDVIWAYSKFVDGLPKKDRDKCCLLMHTAPVDQNGTNLYAVKDDISDCTINIAGNEGFGLTTAESVMAETPIIVNVTGGLQDQCGFRKKSDGKLFTAEDYKKIGSLHNYRDWEDKVTHGEWVKPVWSRVQTMSGSVPTPYIIDDKVDVYEVADATRYWYDQTPKERSEAGKKGREAFMGEMGLNTDNQNKCMSDGILDAIKDFKPKDRYKLYKIA